MVTVKKNEPLKDHSTFRIGGPAGLFLIPETEEELVSLSIEYPHAFILGGGSNLLFSDDGMDVVISMEKIKSIDFELTKDGGALVSTGAGAGLTALCRKAGRMALSGLEFAFGIPGSVGGAVVMNAGAHGGEIKDPLKEIKILRRKAGEFSTMKKEEIGLSYRSSALPEDAVITGVVFKLEKGNPAEISRKMKEADKERKKTQPLDMPSAGSVFKNPPGEFAGKIIDELGLKGNKVGGAEVSRRHANFIVNAGKATAGQVLELIGKIEALVLEKKGIRLEREIRLVGSFDK